MFLCPITTLKQERQNYYGVITATLGDRIRAIVLNVVPPYLKFFGSGTQRVAQELARQLPQLRLIRFDSDTTRH
jgi:hypothetical protein